MSSKQALDLKNNFYIISLDKSVGKNFRLNLQNPFV